MTNLTVKLLLCQELTVKYFVQFFLHSLTLIRTRGRQIAALFLKKARISYLRHDLGGRDASNL
jgi:hypothetical protein